ncbi:hypothetical protein IH879_19175 [candidate division KSB1 bacterium]|nr:hypothetical protein [candidate division KSB1 bacterium]
MKTIRRIFAKVGAGLLMAGLAINFNACTEQSPFEASSTKDQTATLNKRPSLSPEGDTATGNTVEQGSMTSRYYKKWNEYQGGKINLSQGSQFELLYGALTPPAELSGQNVTLTMTVVQDRANNELLFEFGPHGSTFEPAATVWFHYAGSNPKLYYVQEDGIRVEQQPDEVDLVNGWLMLKINHFSRYALAWSN